MPSLLKTARVGDCSCLDEQDFPFTVLMFVSIFGSVLPGVVSAGYEFK